VELSALPPTGRILEIGCGTGQATIPLAERGYRMLCLEPGPRTAAIARKNLARFQQVVLSTSTIELWPVDDDAFDLAIAATSFHWVDPVVAYPKIARALRRTGRLALWWSHHVRAADAHPFFYEVEEVYRRAAPSMAAGYKGLPKPDDVADRAADIEASGLFDVPILRRYRWDVPYDAASYTELLQTYPDHLALDSAERAGLLEGVGTLIDTKYGGRIVKSYLAILHVARPK
jgi:SAM-dependent methyltransferase